MPTATPLYVPPPETQHVKAPPPPTEVPPLPNRLDAANACQSAPELRCIQESQQEIESGSESCTSTTNTTSEDYAHMRIYQPGPPGAIYDQGTYSDSSEYVETGTCQQQQQMMTQEEQCSQMQKHKQSICSTEVTSINESAEFRQSASTYLAKSLDTQCLVNTIRAITPRPASPVPLVQTPRPPKHVEFVGIKDEEVTDAHVIVQESSSSTCQRTCESMSETCCMTSEIPAGKSLPPTNIQNSVPQEWGSAMVRALQTAPTASFGTVSGVISEQAAKGSLMSSVLTTCPSAAMDFTSKFPDPNYPVPLPEEIPAYFPPPINMKVHPNTEIRGAKSPMLMALITAPDRPYSPFPGEVIYQLDDLPTPNCKMDMQSALTTAPARPYTPMQFDRNGLATSTTTDSRSVECFEQTGVSSAFASVTQGTPKPFQPVTTACDQTNGGYVSTATVQSMSNQQESVEQSQTFTSTTSSSTATIEVAQQQKQTESVQGQWHTNEKRGQQQQFISTDHYQHNSNKNSATHHHHHQNNHHQSDAHSIANNASRFGHLHKPDTIPSYQQNFQTLASQQPHRPPVSPQLKDNVPLAFIESPLPPISFDLPDHFHPDFRPSRNHPSTKSMKHPNHNHHHQQQAQPLQQQPQLSKKPEVMSSPAAFSEQQHGHTMTSTTETTATMTCSKKEYGHQQQDYTNFTQITVPVLPKQPNGPITMTFQSLDDDDTPTQPMAMDQNKFFHQPGIGFEYQQQVTQQHQQQLRDEMHQIYSAPRPYTPSMINKPAPIIPHYQKNLSVEECQAANSEIFDPSRRSPSPCPMTKCAAQGPPPNPLKLMAQQNKPQVLESSQFSELQQRDQQNWAGMQGASQTTFLQRPEDVQQTRIGNMNVQTKSNEAHMNQNQRMEAQSQSVQQVGSAQVQRRTRVVEEFERSQTAKTVEIRTNSDGTVTSTVTSGGSGGAIQDSGVQMPKINEDEMPPRGIVANQARRFSQDVTVQPGSSVAAKVQNLNANVSFFPTSPATVEKSRFPVSHAGDAKRDERVVFPPPGFNAGSPGGSLKEQQHRKCVQEMKEQRFTSSKQTNLSSISYSAKPFSYTATSDLTSIPSITQFKPQNTNNNMNKAAVYSSSQTNQGTLPSSPSVYPPTMNPQQHQQQMSSSFSSPQAAVSLPPLTAPLSFSANSSSSAANGTASATYGAKQQSSSLSSSSSFKSTAATGASVSSGSGAGANCSLQTSNMNNKNNNNNNNKGGAGITVGPKRGRGVMNKAVAPGGRIPLCGCCNSQIRLGINGVPSMIRVGVF